MVEFENDWVKA